MFNNFGFGEIAVLALFGLLIFGPEKLPKVAADAARMIRRLRTMATSTVNDFKSDLGPEMADFDISSLNPRRMVQKALFDEEEPAPAGKSSGQTNGDGGRGRSVDQAG
jgi:sec-independent protein translocase protein TatB